METAYIDVPEEFTGTVIEKLSQRKGELQNMGTANGGYSRLEFRIPARGLIGYRDIHFNIIRFCIFSNNHTRIDFLAGTNE